MRKLLFSFAALLCFQLASFSQTVNGTPLRDIDVDYIQIVGSPKAFSTKLKIELDFGQENKIWSNNEYLIKDENGKNIAFNSMIDALNFLTKSGYEFVQAYTLVVSNQQILHYLLRKKRNH